MLFSLRLLVLPPSSYRFSVLYLLCGITDVLDGFAARRLHTESERGAMLDSAADLLFGIAYAVRVLPLLSIPLWVWIWTAIIAVTKITGILIASRKAQKLRMEHSPGNKLTGFLLFLMPLSNCFGAVKYAAALVCMTASATTVGEIRLIGGEKCLLISKKNIKNSICPKTSRRS